MVAHTLRFNTVVQALEPHLDEIGAIHTISMSQRRDQSTTGWTILRRPVVGLF